MKPSRELRDRALGLAHDFAQLSPDIVADVSNSADAVFIGSDAREAVVGGPEIRALVRRQFDELRPVIGSFRLGPVRAVAFEDGDVGWTLTEFSLTGPDDTDLHFRITQVFHREESAWKVVHLHASVPRPNEELIPISVTTSIDDIADLVEKERPDLAPVASSGGTLTIMFTDIEASTATNEAMGDDRFLPLLIKHNQIVERHTGAGGGSVVKSQGDGFMLAFPSARRAVECAVAIQREVSAVDECLKIRMGMHTGEPTKHAQDFYGRDVAYAARLGSAALGGEILVSSLVRDLVQPSGSVVFAGPRELELKGFDGLQSAYTVEW